MMVGGVAFLLTIRLANEAAPVKHDLTAGRREVNKTATSWTYCSARAITENLCLIYRLERTCYAQITAIRPMIIHIFFQVAAKSSNLFAAQSSIVANFACEALFEQLAEDK